MDLFQADHNLDYILDELQSLSHSVNIKNLHFTVLQSLFPQNHHKNLDDTFNICYYLNQHWTDFDWNLKKLNRFKNTFDILETHNSRLNNELYLLSKVLN